MYLSQRQYIPFLTLQRENITQLSPALLETGGVVDAAGIDQYLLLFI